MKKVIVALLLMVMAWLGGYEVLNKADMSVQKAWGQVESVLQRRYDLIPNLVNTVKSYAGHEKSVMSEVTKLRAEIGKIKTGDLVNSAEKMAEFNALSSQMSGALSKLMVVVENYPQLKADQTFLTLQSQLEGTENRINVERQRFNDAVENLNYYVRNLVLRIIARVHGFEQKGFFKSNNTAEKAPVVSFE